MTKEKIFKTVLSEGKKDKVPFQAKVKNADPKTGELLEKEIGKIIRNPKHKDLTDVISLVGSIQSSEGLTPNQKRVLASLYDELMGDCDPAYLRHTLNKWI